jgi:hypothetical protein
MSAANLNRREAPQSLAGAAALFGVSADSLAEAAA